jgi:hypothetical protein
MNMYVFRATKLSCYIPSLSQYPVVIEFSHILKFIYVFIYSWPCGTIKSPMIT